jgi:hypothetical protein
MESNGLLSCKSENTYFHKNGKSFNYDDNKPNRFLRNESPCTSMNNSNS